MSGLWTLPAWLVLCAVALLAVLLVVATSSTLRRRGATRSMSSELERALAVRDAETAELRQRLARLEERSAQPVAPARHAVPDPAPGYLITDVGGPHATTADLAEPGAAPVVPTLPPGQFTDVVLRESAVRLGSLAHGLRRAASPEVRGRIRAEMRRETKRARKVRRTEQREALRDWQARQRAAGAPAEPAA